MKLEEIKKVVKEVDLVTLRCDSDELFEAVFNTSELEQLSSRLVKIFGDPLFPLKKDVRVNPEELARDYGGIMPGQTLYYLEQEEGAVLAMIWPWQDKVNITLKLIRKPGKL